MNNQEQNDLNNLEEDLLDMSTLTETVLCLAVSSLNKGITKAAYQVLRYRPMLARHHAELIEAGHCFLGSRESEPAVPLTLRARREREQIDLLSFSLGQGELLAKADSRFGGTNMDEPILQDNRRPADQNLRRVTTIMRIGDNLEAIGDEAVVIARQTLELNGETSLRYGIDVMRLTVMVCEVQRDALCAFVKKDEEGARAAFLGGKAAEALNQLQRRKLTVFIQKGGSRGQGCLPVLTALMSLKSVAAAATGIAAKVLSPGPESKVAPDFEN